MSLEWLAQAGGAEAASGRVLEAVHHPVMVVDAAGTVIYANVAATDNLGSRVVNASLSDTFPGYSPPAGRGAPWSARLVAASGEGYDALFKPIEDGCTCVSLWSGTLVVPDRAPPVDDLTGLALRGGFMSALEEASADTGPGIVLCLDLDRFKIVNDTLGHGVGDLLLRKVAERLRSACRREDVVARLGGDEFAVLQRGTVDLADAEKLAARLVDLVGRTYVLGGHTVNIGVSVGIAVGGCVGGPDLLRNADLALYEAKRAGRGRFRFFEQGMDAAARERRDMEVDLRRALALKQFALHYQPFLDLSTDRVIGFEALLRWNHPVRGQVPPLDFVPVAEENGLIVRIGEWVLTRACQTAATWPGELVVAVNVSPLQFKADTLMASVASALAKSGLPPERLEIEITESALLADTANVLATLRALRELGVRISMDDFGTGYSSLSYLQKFPFNKIKIDRSFVAGDDPDSAAILRAVSGLGASLGMAITAEGVETAEQLSRIRDQNCTHVQGYLTGRPMAEGDVASFLAAKREGASQ